MDNKFIEDLKLNIALDNCIENINYELSQKNENKKRGFFMRKKIIATACASLALISGIVVATNIDKIKRQDRGLGGGVQNAVENGYIAEPNIEFTNIDNVGVDITLENFLMDDVNLSTNIIFNFNNMNDEIDLNSIYEVELNDLIIKDEENRILYGGNDKDRFEKYCRENNLEYSCGEFNENYINSGVNCFIENKEKDSLSLLYNMYSGNYPKSKKLYFSINEIIMKTEQRDYKLNGNWQVNVDVPEEMYNRTEEYYKVVSCDNDDFDVYTAKVTNTGFEIGLIISNIEKPEEDFEKILRCGTLNEDYENGKITLEEANELIEWYSKWYDLSHPIAINKHNYKKEYINASYIENENSIKFECSKSAGRKQKMQFLEGNKFNFYETFNLTKYDATDKVTAVLYYYGTPVTIELERIK